MWKTKFAQKILTIIFDEAHCISQWGDFRSEYKSLGELRYQINNEVPFYAVSATLPLTVMADIKRILRLWHGKTVYIQRTTDRPDIGLMVWSLSYPVKSYRDLEFLLPKIENECENANEITVRKFVVFFDSILDTEQATRHLRSLLPDAFKNKIKWFHATMTSTYCKNTIEAFRSSEIWGLCATDAFGMVSLPVLSNEHFA